MSRPPGLDPEIFKALRDWDDNFHKALTEFVANLDRVLQESRRRRKIPVPIPPCPFDAAILAMRAEGAAQKQAALLYLKKIVDQSYADLGLERD